MFKSMIITYIVVNKYIYNNYDNCVVEIFVKWWALGELCTWHFQTSWVLYGLKRLFFITVHRYIWKTKCNKIFIGYLLMGTQEVLYMYIFSVSCEQICIRKFIIGILQEIDILDWLLQWSSSEKRGISGWNMEISTSSGEEKMK